LCFACLSRKGERGWNAVWGPYPPGLEVRDHQFDLIHSLNSLVSKLIAERLRLLFFRNAILRVATFFLGVLALRYRTQGNYAKAEPLYQRSLEFSEKALGPDHPVVATALNNLAELYKARDNYAEAEPLSRRSLAISEKALGPDHPDVGITLDNLAGLYYAQGKYAEAEPLLQRSLAILEKALGPDHPNVATNLMNYAALLRETYRSNEAAEMDARAKVIRAKYE